MGAHGSGPGAEGGVRTLDETAAAPTAAAAATRKLKPPPDRLYGRRHTYTLRPRQVRLIAETLPRLRPTDAEIAAPPRPLWLEVGFGGGEHALAQITAHPEVTLIACEVFENGICSLLSRLVPEGGEATAPLPSNLRVWDQDARDLIRRLPAACLDRVFLLFPDPWPKLRHAKRRFVHPAFLPEMARVMRAGAEWRIASDDPTYQAWVAETLAGQGLFEVDPVSCARPSDQPGTRYEAKAIAAGRTPKFWRAARAGV